MYYNTVKNLFCDGVHKIEWDKMDKFYKESKIMKKYNNILYKFSLLSKYRDHDMKYVIA